MWFPISYLMLIWSRIFWEWYVHCRSHFQNVLIFSLKFKMSQYKQAYFCEVVSLDKLVDFEILIKFCQVSFYHTKSPAWKKKWRTSLSLILYILHTSNIEKIPQGYIGWWHNALRMSMPSVSSFVQECDCTSHDIDRVSFERPNSWSLGTLKALRYHPMYPLRLTQRLYCVSYITCYSKFTHA